MMYRTESKANSKRYEKAYSEKSWNKNIRNVLEALKEKKEIPKYKHSILEKEGGPFIGSSCMMMIVIV